MPDKYLPHILKELDRRHRSCTLQISRN